MGFYVYKFINLNGDIIYVGQTLDINKRIEKQHFNIYGHLPQECYKETVKVYFAEFKSGSDMDIMERYLIAKHRPKYNIAGNVYDVSIIIAEPEWIDYSLHKEIYNSKNELYKEKTTIYLERWLKKDIQMKLIQEHKSLTELTTELLNTWNLQH